MIFRNFIKIFLVLIVCSCSNDEIVKGLSEKKPLTYFDHNGQTGITIDNGPRQGFRYNDAKGVAYTYVYITTTVTNDSIVPIQLNIAFSNDYNFLRSRKTLFSEVFLLPRTLTPEKQQFDVTMSKELKHFLDTGRPSDSLNITLAPKAKCVMTFGVLTKLGEKEPFTLELKLLNNSFDFNKQDSLLNASLLKSEGKAVPLVLLFSNPLIIPCGHILFSDKVSNQKQ